ncbi:MAG: kelch repeat-containing protein [Phycisphaerae bacterium]
MKRRIIAKLAALSAGLLVLRAWTAAQCTTDWATAATTGPTIRSYLGLSYDSARQVCLLYGGANNNTLRSDVWEWDGSIWTQRLASGGAGARRAMALAYDAAHGRVLSFGGVTSGGINGETWEYDGVANAWTQRAIGATAPSPRGFLAAAYDSAHQNVVIVGGWGGGFSYYGDTWLWDGSAWTNPQPSASPPPRAFHACAYDASRGRVVLFGGLLNSTSGSTYYDDTWEWDGTAWEFTTPLTRPPARAYHAMAYDADRHRVVLFGGFEFSAGTFSDTWEWDGNDWTQITPTQAPSLRQNHAMTFDAARHETVLFGGQLNSTTRNDTWTYAGSGPLGDLTGDGVVNEPDLGVLLSAWYQSGAGDLDGDGLTSEPDLGILLANWAQTCP